MEIPYARMTGTKLWAYTGSWRLTRVALCMLVVASAVDANANLLIVDDVSRHQLVENANRVVQALEDLGAPISDANRNRIEAAVRQSDDEAIVTIQRALDPYCLVEIHLDEEAWMRVRPASVDPDARRLVQHTWKTFLVKVHNEAHVTTSVGVASPQALLPGDGDPQDPLSQISSDDPYAWSRWIALKLVQDPPLHKKLSGSHLEYMILQVYSRDDGIRAADLVFNLAGGVVTQGRYADTSLLFYIEEAAR